MHGSWHRSSRELPHLPLYSLAPLSCYLRHRPSADNNLGGKIPTELALLSKLTRLDLQTNQLTGTISPVLFENMPDLESINFLHNGLVGALPASLGMLTRLQSVVLSSNKLTGSIPSSWRGLGNTLRLLALDNNRLATSVVESASGDNSWMVMNDLTNLRALYIQQNDFRIDLDETEFLPALMPNLVHLDASHNHLEGRLPRHLLISNRLEVLDLHSNNIQGTVFSSEINNDDDSSSSSSSSKTNNASNTNDRQFAYPLQVLSLQHNQLTGTIHPSVLGQRASLQHLDLSSNRLTGTMPSVGSLTDLQHLFLGQNDWEAGIIPDTLQYLHKLRYLSLRNTSRTGGVPLWVGRSFRKMILLDLGDNSLDGTIPTELASMPYLSLLFLDNNHLTGQIKTELSPLHQLCECGSI